MHIFDMCTIDLQNKTFYLKTVGGVIHTIGGTLLAAVHQPARHFYHFNDRIFLKENLINKWTSFLCVY